MMNDFNPFPALLAFLLLLLVASFSQGTAPETETLPAWESGGYPHAELCRDPPNRDTYARSVEWTRVCQWST